MPQSARAMTGMGLAGGRPRRGGPEPERYDYGYCEPRQAGEARHKVMGNEEESSLQAGVAESEEPQERPQETEEAGRQHGRGAGSRQTGDGAEGPICTTGGRPRSED